MPFIQCEIHEGLDEQRKRMLSTELARVVNQTLGSPIPYIHVVIRETPSSQFVEAGKLDTPYGQPC